MPTLIADAAYFVTLDAAARLRQLSLCRAILIIRLLCAFACLAF